MLVKLKTDRQVYGLPLQQPGEIIDLPADEALRLIACRQAESAEPAEKEKEEQ